MGVAAGKLPKISSIAPVGQVVAGKTIRTMLVDTDLTYPIEV